ncbi:Aldehyde/histidinol dehydrogenase [Penicillium cf. griseofulvum]|nr:Aldehyde/histidinol dehydrogenase [Penicillium cf. griseofulvum]
MRQPSSPGLLKNGDVIPSSYANSTVLTYKEPVGVCGIITPCSVAIKPPSETPFSAIALAKLALKAGIPSSLIHVIPTKDRKASLELATNPLVRKISFTGSTAVGKMLTKLASETMKKVSMELGGNAPFVVFEDADLDQAVDAALICKLRASGQTCVSSFKCANRLYVHKQVLEAFAEKLAAKVQALKLGRGIDDGTTQGPLVNAAAVAKVKAHIADALAKGGQLWTGGQAPSHLSGFFFEPTIITGTTPDMDVATDETFGPLAAIFPFESEEDVVTQANASEYGLAGYFFSQNVSRIFRVARQLECGMIGVNTGMISAAETPFGGTKESGVGREGSRYGLSEYQNIKSVTIGNLR